MSTSRWFRVVGATGVVHLATDTTTGAAGTYLGFACGKTFSVAEVTTISAEVGNRRKCATCSRSKAATAVLV